MKYSVTIPVYNEEDILPVLTERLVGVLSSLGEEWEIVYVSDGSVDRTWELICDFHARDARIGGVHFSRNFGHQPATAAGLRAVTGDVVILMDGDLQDPPELLPAMIAQLHEGFDVVMAVKLSRAESPLKRWGFSTFYRIQSWLSSVRLEPEAGNFSAMTRRVVDLINAMPERNRYLSGLRAFSGFQQTTIPFDRPNRFTGQPRMSLAKLMKLAMDGIYANSHLPVKCATWLGIGTAFVSLLGTAVVLYGKLFAARAVPGWAPTTLALLFLGAIQLICLGILGEYIVRIYDEVRQRPQYVIAEECLPGERVTRDLPSGR